MPKEIKQQLGDMMLDLFERAEKGPVDKRSKRIEARNREMPKICAMLDIEYKPMREDAA
ncbi:hypothetical protein [Pseudohongiella sp. O18]|uniref:hypothetical protein n=1 Tax=Pseudohongiella sp. O18 TaxID=2904248 RepID=UPI001F42CA54|nr:hypothetical protein [Pseudohongiella sp. O18]